MSKRELPRRELAGIAATTLPTAAAAATITSLTTRAPTCIILGYIGRYVDERVTAEEREQREMAENGTLGAGAALPPPVERQRRRSAARSRSIERTPPPVDEPLMPLPPLSMI